MNKNISSARPAVIFPTAEHHRPLSSTKLSCLATEEYLLHERGRVDCRTTIHSNYTLHLQLRATVKRFFRP